MDRIAEFIRLCDLATGEAEKVEAQFIRDQRSKFLIDQVRTVNASLRSLAKKAEEGNLAPSNGAVALGLGRWVTEWGVPIGKLDDLCYRLDAFYRKNL